MLSADVPEFIPKAQRSQPVTVSDLPQCDTKEEQPESVALQPASASLADDHKEGDPKDTQSPNVQSKASDPESFAADRTVGTCASANVDQVDSIFTSQNNASENSLFPHNVNQATNGVNHVIENKYPNSKLSATVPEFVPANPVFLDCASTESSNSHLPYTPATSGAPYMYPGSPYGYYPSWAPEVDYSAGYFSPLLNAGAYSGEFYVPDGGYVYDGADSYAQPGPGMVMDPMYYDSNMMGAMEYSSGVAYSAYGSNYSGRGGGRGSSNYNRRPYNSNYKRGGGRRTDSGRGGGRGGGGGGSRQPSTEIGICSQTGEMTLSKRRTQQNNTQNKSDANGWSAQTHVQASNIIKNANNWPSLAQGKSDQTSGVVTPVESMPIQDPHLPLTNGTPLSAMPTDSFSAIAKKKSANAEVSATKPSKDAKAGVTSQQKSGRAIPAQPLNETKVISNLDNQASKPTCSEQPGLVCSNGIASDVNDAKNANSEQKAEPLDSKPSEDIEDQPKLSKSSKKKARRKQKKLRESDEKAVEDLGGFAANSVAVKVSPQPNSVSTVPSMASILSNDLKKDRIPINSAPSSNSTSLKKTQKEAHSSTKPSKDLPAPVVNNVAPVKSVEQTVTKSVSEDVGEKDSAPKDKEDEEEEWITVGKKSKGKKGAMNKEGERSGSLGFRQANNDWSGSNFRGPQQAKHKKLERKQSDRPERISTNHVNFQEKQTPDRAALSNGRNSSEARVADVPLVDDTVANTSAAEHKHKDPNDPEYKEILRKRALKKETVKQEKKIVRETVALQKQANARKDSKISVLQPDVPKPSTDLKCVPKNETFRIKSEEYPSLGSNKKAKQLQNVLVKSEMTKMNGIVQDSANGVPEEVPAWVRSCASSSSAQSPVGDVCASPSHSTSGKKIAASRVAGPVKASAKNSSYVAAAAAAAVADNSSTVASTVADPSVRKKTIPSLPKSTADGSKKAKSGKKSTSSSVAVSRPKVKTTDKLTIDLNLVIKKKIGQQREKAARSTAAPRSQDSARRAAAGGPPARPPRLAVHASNSLREKGKKKSVTAIQRYKTSRAQDRENFLRLLDAQRRQNERAAAGGDADDVSGQQSSAGDAAGADGWMDVGEESPNSPKKISSPPQEAAAAAVAAPDLVIAKLREELPHILVKKQSSGAASYRYDKNMVTDELRDHLKGMLSKLVEFQKRKFAMEQIKAKSKRRYVCGIREATKKVEKLKMLIVATDVAKSIPLVTEGLSQLIVKAEEHKVPVVFGMSRLKLAQICKTLKNKKVSCVGIMNYQGTENHVSTILALLPELRKQWQRTVLASNTYYENSVVPSSSLSPSTGTSSVVSSSVSKATLPTTASSSSSSSSAVAPSSSVDARASLAVRRPDDVTVRNAKLAKGKNGMTSATNSTLEVSQKIVGILKDKRESS